MDKQKPDPGDVKETLIVTHCSDCPNDDDGECGDHSCFLWQIFGILSYSGK